MIVKQKLPAGVLPFVITISLMVAVICSAAVLLTYYHQITILKGRIEEQLRHNVASGFQYGLATLTELPEQEWLAFDLFGEGADSVRILKERWGVFEVLKVEAQRGSHRYGRIALLGTGLKDNKPALYLEDNRRSLSLAGDAEIRGDAYLPKAGVKADYVNRKGYSREKLVYGKIFESESKLPQLQQESLKYLINLVEKQGGAKDPKAAGMSYFSFGQEMPLSLNFPGKVTLKDSLVGKILVRAEMEIVVPKGVYIKDVLLIAPKISIQKGFRGQLQALATDTLVLEEAVILQYPSAIGLLAEKESSLLYLKEGSRVEGLVFQYGKGIEEDFNLLIIEKDSQVLGEVWSNGFVDHQGEIEGTLSCRKFYLRTPASIYENYLFNGRIRRSKLPPFFVSTPLLNSNGKNKLIKWLD